MKGCFIVFFIAVSSLPALAQNTFPATGNVGIGTASPANLLDVRGTIYTNGSMQVDGGDVYISRTTNAFGYVIRPNVAGYKNLQFSVSGGGPLDNITSNAAVSYFTGKIGVGTSTPGGILQASDGGDDPTKYGTLQLVRATNPTDNVFHLSFIRAGMSVCGMGYTKDATNTLGIWQANNNAGVPLMAFNVNQTVGINTQSTQGYTLAVNGSAIFTKAVVKLYASWPDYVFERTYHLSSLNDLEKYINSNHHLPEMPVADSVQRSGIDLGASQGMLLKKIEELTLYVISLNKTLQAQNAIVHTQAKKIKKIQKLLNKMEK